MLFSINVKAQGNSNYTKLIYETDTFYGDNDLIHSGEIYRPEHAYAKGHPYFLTNAYFPVMATVKGNSFKNVTAKYNIETDQLILLSPDYTNSVRMIAIKQNGIDSFKIDNHLFVNISNYDSSKTLRGYYELVYSGKKSFFIKYSKKFINTYNDLSPNGFYSVVKTSFFIYDGVRFINVRSKKEFLQLCNVNKIAVKKYIRANRIRFLKSSSVQLKMLMQYWDGISN